MALTVGLLAFLEAKPGKEDELWTFLEGGRALADAEPDTRTWYAFRVNHNTFGIFDTFETEDGRQAHLSGAVVAALGEHGPDLLARDPDISQVEIIASK